LTAVSGGGVGSGGEGGLPSIGGRQRSGEETMELFPAIFVSGSNREKTGRISGEAREKTGSSNREKTGRIPGDRHRQCCRQRVRARDRASVRDRANAREAGNWIREVDAATGKE